MVLKVICRCVGRLRLKVHHKKVMDEENLSDN